MMYKPLLIFTFFFLLNGCTKKTSQEPFWIYTSLYPHVVQEVTTLLKKKFPDVDFKWYQAGSENVAAKVNAELLSGKTQASLLLTSDPFWYEDLKKRDVLLAYETLKTKDLSNHFKDPHGFYAVCRFPVMVIGYNSDTNLPLPNSFADLTKPIYKDKLAMPNPLESGTAFTAVALLSKKLGWDYFRKLRGNGILVSGGNSAVLGRIETKERPIGIVLLENILQAAEKNPKIKAQYPEDGVVLIPSPIAIVKTTPNKELAQKVYDFFFEHEAQKAIVKSKMYSPFVQIPPPLQAKPFLEIIQNALPWNSNILEAIYNDREEIKKQFFKTVLE